MNQTNHASSATASPTIPYPSAPPAAKRSRLFYIGLVGMIAGGICCLLSVVLLIVYFTIKPKATPVSAPPAQSPSETTQPVTSTSLPTIAPVITSAPVSTATPPQPATSGNATSFNDNFSDPNSGWRVGSTDNSQASYNSSGFYEMEIKTAKYYLVSLSPDSFPKPLKNVQLSVRAQPGVGNTGEYGVVCRFQDINNFYLAGISGNQFYIGKQVKGEWTYLTDPKWQTLPDTTTDAEGYLTIDMSCNDAFIVLDVNGIGAAHVTDDTFSTGDVGLCVWGGDTADKYGYYARAGFDDFSVQLAQP